MATMYVFSYHFEMRVASRVRRVVYIYVWPGWTIWRSIWVNTEQLMTEELAYSSLIDITMSMNTKSWIFGLTESEKIRYVYAMEILLNTTTTREVNSTEIDSNSTARETQDYGPLQRQATNNQTNFHNFKTRN